MIVRGLIAVLHALYSGLHPEAVVAVDAPAELGRLGLDQHLSSQRSNGLRSMVGADPRHRPVGAGAGLSMATPLETLLAERGWLLADGATGTNLFDMGLEAGEAPELWNETEPGKVRALYDGAIGAGSDLFLTNSFGGNASRLKLHEAEGRAFELNRIAAAIAREAADAAGRPVVVAGSMGPTGEIMAPLGPLTVEDAAEMFEEQARGLLAGGADVLWVETISAPDEFQAAALGIARTGAPWCGTMSFDTAGRTMMGADLRRHGGAGRRAGAPAAGLRRQLRGRGLGPPAHRARLPRRRIRACR